MKKYFLPLILGILLLTGCGEKPEKTAEKFIEAIYKGDSDKMISYIYFPDESVKDGSKEMLSGKLKMAANEQFKKANEKGGVSKIKTTDSDIENDNAYITINVEFKDKTNKTERVRLQKIKSDWKVIIR